MPRHALYSIAAMANRSVHLQRPFPDILALILSLLVYRVSFSTDFKFLPTLSTHYTNNLIEHNQPNSYRYRSETFNQSEADVVLQDPRSHPSHKGKRNRVNEKILLEKASHSLHRKPHPFPREPIWDPKGSRHHTHLHPQVIKNLHSLSLILSRLGFIACIVGSILGRLGSVRGDIFGSTLSLVSCFFRIAGDIIDGVTSGVGHLVA